ncbi:hypothetical protein F2Q69_00048573 [Brassica cretica]|uniref:Uncharacterized protein n=1 Tax=Brassica cretica TaxID=69181 RepID=A0A8S9PND5_BRACR|nr:hypothetical protein F2Q69_00048573 [Brassica cretica]
MCSFFSEGDLYDLHHFGDILSWRGQHRDHLFRCRLDRDVTNRFQYLAYEGSDHKPIISFLEPAKKKRRGIFIYDSGLRAPENQIFGETNLEEHHQFVYQLLGKNNAARKSSSPRERQRPPGSFPRNSGSNPCFHPCLRKKGSNLTYVTMATNEQDELLPATLREIELQTQLGALQSQVTELHKAQDTAAKYPKLLSEDQNLKDRLGEHSKLLEESTKNLSQFEAENLVLRDENQALNTTSNKRCRFRSQPPPLNGDAATGDGAVRRTRTYTAEESDSEMEANEETPEGVAATRSTLTAYLEPVFFKKFDVIQSMVERAGSYPWQHGHLPWSMGP